MNDMQKKITLAELAMMTESKLCGDPDKIIYGIAGLGEANGKQVSFLENPRYERLMKTSQAGAVFVTPLFACSPGKNYLIHQHPSLAFQGAVEFFLAAIESGFTGIHPTAVIHPEAFIENLVSIGPFAVIDRRAHIGKGTSIGSHVAIGAETIVGRDCMLHPGAIVREGCTLGDRVILQPGAVIGSCGFGYATDKKGVHHHLKQLGNVVIEDDVEIGANTTIDRARFETTRIGKGTKIDNMVQIGHQVCLGQHNLICGKTGIAGSTTTGDHVTMGGDCGLNGHIHIPSGSTLAAGSLVSKSLPKKDVYMGVPAMPEKEFKEYFIQLRKVKRLAERLKELEEITFQKQKPLKPEAS